MASKIAAATRERISRLGQRRQVVIPRDIAESLQMREGDFVAITQKADAVVIKRRRVVDPDDVLTPAESKKVRQALREVREGKTTPWAKVKDELGL
jgi:AbrB family looped-hinge helix DNA binding protein